MAVRNLTLLFNSIRYYEARLETYIARLEDNDISKDRIIEYFEEIIDWCKSLREICLTSIENWEDIILEVKDLTSKIGTLFELRITENELKNQLASLTQKLEKSEEVKEKTEEEKQELEKQLLKKEGEFNKIADQVKELKESIRSSVGGLTTNTNTLATSGYSGIDYINYFDPRYAGIQKRICQYCNKEYTPKGYGLLFADNVCEECAKKRGRTIAGGS